MRNNTMIIGIAGPSASGKSLLANTIVRELGSDQVAVITEDSYYRDRKDISFEERAKINYDHPDSFDHELFTQHLKALQNGETVQVPQYDFTQHVRSSSVREIGKHTIIVLEGILLFFEPSKRYADIIVPRGGENRIAIDMIKAKMRELLVTNLSVNS